MPIEADRIWKEEIDSSIQLVFGMSIVYAVIVLYSKWFKKCYYSESGQTSTIKMDDLSSSAILTQLMLAAGGDNWVEYENRKKSDSVPAPEKRSTASIRRAKSTKSAASHEARASASWLFTSLLCLLGMTSNIIGLTFTWHSANKNSILFGRDIASEKHN